MEYYRISGGGVTFSGGEPLVWSSELLLVVRLCKQEGISVAIETAGAVPFDDMKRLIPYVDKWIYDIKLMDSKLHQTWCGMGNELILGNLKQLTQYGVDICVKMPIIPTVNDTEKNVRQMITYLNDLCRIRDVELLPYHTLGKSKYIALGRDYPLAQVPVPTEAMMDHFNDILHKELNLESYKEASNGIPSNATHFKIERTVI
jgi:pyruvate formate lyase activating enzyme